MVLGMFAFTWMGVLLGMLVRSPDAMQGVGFIVIFPLAFMAGTFVPIAGMDAVPRAIAALGPDLGARRHRARAHRGRALDAGPGSSSIRSSRWPSGACVIIAVCVPLALRRFNRTLAG